MSTAPIATALMPALEASGFVGTWETDLSTGIVHPSDRFAELLGLEPRCVAEGVHLFALLGGVHEADRERVGTLVHKAHVGAGSFEAEFRTLGRGGIPYWVAARGRVETDAHGRGVRCRGIVMDITDARGAASDGAASRILDEIADKVLAARRLADAHDSKLLRTTLDLLLFQLGRELAKGIAPSQGSLH